MSDPTILTAPILGHVEGVELMETGTWNASTGPATFTPDDLASAIAALDCPAIRRPILKGGHNATADPGQPALGYVANLRTSNEGQTLVGDYRGMPGWLTEVDDAGDSVLASAYPDRSIEGEWDYHCQLGHTHPFVVHAVALLGIERPAIGTLESLQELYGVVATTEASLTARLVEVSATHPKETPMPQPVNAAATTDDVRRAYYAGPGADWDIWIREMYVDPTELIVDNDADGTILRVPYAIAADGTVTFSDPQPVKVTYVAARAQAAPPLVTFASHAESRPGERPTDPNTPAATADGPSNTEGGSAVAFSDEQITTLRESIGLPADADETAILAGLAEALAERADPPTTTTLPDGTVPIDAEQLAGLLVDASAGREARTQQLTERREALVSAAVRDGRIAPVRREAWLAQLAADPGSETVLASLAKGLVPVAASGYTGGDEDIEDTAAGEFAGLFPPAPDTKEA